MRKKQEEMRWVKIVDSKYNKWYECRNWMNEEMKMCKVCG